MAVWGIGRGRGRGHIVYLAKAEHKETIRDQIFDKLTTEACPLKKMHLSDGVLKGKFVISPK